MTTCDNSALVCVYVCVFIDRPPECGFPLFQYKMTGGAVVNQ
jgi:hypothetical protein